jgi:hypothetical protein
MQQTRSGMERCDKELTAPASIFCWYLSPILQTST